MTNPRCPHCGGRTVTEGLGSDSIHYKCQTTGCRMTVVLRRGEPPATSGPCLTEYRDDHCPHSPWEARVAAAIAKAEEGS